MMDFKIIAILGMATGLSTGWSAAVGAVGAVTGNEAPRSPGAVTFSGQIARIIHQRCAGCHHEGQSAPFNLVSYDDVRKRAKQILEVTESHIMPPWLAEPGYGTFSNERRLTGEEQELIHQWVNTGALEGDSGTAPPTPQWPSGWLEGKPDLVVTMQQAYPLGPEGPDVYRNFVIPLQLERDRWVRAVEFSPGNRRIVHHAFVRVDESGELRRLDGKDGEPGYQGMSSKAKAPGGQFLSWNPGTQPIVAPPGLAWRLARGSDLVVQLHLNRTGKPETIQSSVGLYFTEEQPTNSCHLFKLGSFALNFPAGATNEIVRDTFTLPVDLDLLAVFPHGHFLTREIQAYAVLPDGAKEWLIWIKQWDFKWQGDYRYKKPVHLPKGTTLHVQYTYDNSTNNLNNPNRPPKRVVYGEQSSDEMCEVAFQVVVPQKGEFDVLQGALATHLQKLLKDELLQTVALDPKNAAALSRLGMTLWRENRREEAWDHLERALALQPDLAEAHYNKGVVLRFDGRTAESRKEFETTLRLDPRHAKAYQQLGFALATLGQLKEAEQSFEKALEFDPTDGTTKAGLQELRQLLKSR